MQAGTVNVSKLGVKGAAWVASTGSGARGTYVNTSTGQLKLSVSSVMQALRGKSWMKMWEHTWSSSVNLIGNAILYAMFALKGALLQNRPQINKLRQGMNRFKECIDRKCSPEKKGIRVGVCGEE